MTPAQLAQAARDALNLLGDQQSVHDNDPTRARILRALESLDPGVAEGSAAERRRRHYRIVVDCDIRHLPHAQVASNLGLSRRQFYRERKDALVAYGSALQTSKRAPVQVQVDAKDVQLLYIQALHGRGQYEAVWRESARVLAHMNGHPREIEVWRLAAEAARLSGNEQYARDAIDQMHHVASRSAHEDLRRASQLHIAISQTALDLMLGNLSAAKSAFDATTAAWGDERTMYGRDAALFSILLNDMAIVAMDTGDWRLAKQYLHRLATIDERSEVRHAVSSSRRLRGRIALRREGDIGRAVVELRDALSIAESNRTLYPAAYAAVELGVALTQHGDAAGAEYLEYGLKIARGLCGDDEFAVLFASAVRVMLQRGAPEAPLRAFEEMRVRSRLFGRAERYARLAEVELQLASGDYRAALESSMGIADEGLRAHMLPLAANAQVLVAEAFAHCGRVTQAKKSLIGAVDLIAEHGWYCARERAYTLGTRLALQLAVI